MIFTVFSRQVREWRAVFDDRLARVQDEEADGAGCDAEPGRWGARGAGGAPPRGRRRHRQRLRQEVQILLDEEQDMQDAARRPA